MAMQESLQLTPKQKEEMVRLRANSFAKQAQNQAQWHQLCAAISQVPAVAQRRTYLDAFATLVQAYWGWGFVAVLG